MPFNYSILYSYINIGNYVLIVFVLWERKHVYYSPQHIFIQANNTFTLKYNSSNLHRDDAYNIIYYLQFTIYVTIEDLGSTFFQT